MTQPVTTNDTPQQQSRFKSIFYSILKFAVIYWISKNFFGGQKQSKNNPKNGENNTNLEVFRNIWEKNELFDFRIYFSEREMEFENPEKSQNFDLIWTLNGLDYNDSYKIPFKKHISFETSENLRLKNGSLFAHVYFYKNGFSPFKTDSNYDEDAFLRIFELVRFRKKPIEKTFKNLLFSSENTEYLTDLKNNPESIKNELNEEENGQNFKDFVDKIDQKPKSENRPIIGFWSPKFVLSLVFDQSKYGNNRIPEQIREFIKVKQSKFGDFYFPISYKDDFWTLEEHLTEINSTSKKLELDLQFNPISMWKWQLKSQIELSFAMQKKWGTSEDGDSDSLKRMLLESNPYFLGITFVVTLFHSIFDFLAFKNDIYFWKTQKDMNGLSVRTIFLNCFCSIIVFLYLLENETSWMILMSSAVAIIIELWKIKKAAKVTFGLKGYFGLIPWLKIEDRESYIKSNTYKYDKEAMRYLSFVLYPLVFGYSVYSLFYEDHKGWYQWILSSLVGSVYTFGFIMMCPQLYLNYKLKSVSHLPWRMMTYKALNTVIDDLFAFVIKMPTLHRISCFRDDIVFLIFLYQKWIYRIDYTRTNEFGYNPQNELESNEETDKKND